MYFRNTTTIQTLKFTGNYKPDVLLVSSLHCLRITCR